jgi:hypothetical protein
VRWSNSADERSVKVSRAGRPYVADRPGNTYGWQIRDYRPFLDRLTAGDQWAFRLLANPVQNVLPVGRNVTDSRC